MVQVRYIFLGIVCENWGEKMGVKQALKSLDAFPRAEEHLLQKTQSGAFGNILFLFKFSVCFCSLIIIVFWIENLFAILLV